MNNTKDEKLKDLNFWEKKSKDYSWLLGAISKLITEKIRIFKEKREIVTDPKSFMKNNSWEGIKDNLQMLYEFYQHYSNNPSLRFKIVFLVPSSDNMYLKPLFWYNPDQLPPDSYERENVQRERFHKTNSTSLAVKAWNSRRMEVAETESDLNYYHAGQEEVIKSMIAYPVNEPGTSKVKGIITVAANTSYFFKESEAKLHEEYVYQTGIRIALELVRCELMA